jgi:hypothetical protein
MSDSEEKKRPNANYRLSWENADPPDIVYHYNRERRLEKAPQAVRDLYRETPPRRFGLFKSLVESKPRAFLFYTIVVLCITIFILSSLDLIGNTHSLDGNQLSIQAIRFEDMIIVAIKKTARKTLLTRLNPIYTGAVDIAVLPAGDLRMENAFFHRIFFTVEQTEHYRFVIPFDTDELQFVIQTEKRKLTVKIKPE